MAATLIVNPRSDEEFVRIATAEAETADSAQELQARLRTRYRHAVVRPRELDGEPGAVWYVYRDGHWRPG